MKFCEDLEAEPSKKLQITLTDEGYKHLKQADLVPYKDKIPIANSYREKECSGGG